MPLLHPKNTFLHPLFFLMPCLSHHILQLHSLFHILKYQLIWHKGRQLQMEDVEYDSQIDDDKWEDMNWGMIWRTW